MIRRSALALAVCASAQPGFAQAANSWACQGVLPAWHLDLTETEGRLATNQDITMPVMDITRAEGRAWPRAFTLVGDQDTAIVIITPRSCLLNEAQFDTHVQVLTQQDNLPILLDGCCRAVATE